MQIKNIGGYKEKKENTMEIEANNTKYYLPIDTNIEEFQIIFANINDKLKIKMKEYPLLAATEIMTILEKIPNSFINNTKKLELGTQFLTAIYLSLYNDGSYTSTTNFFWKDYNIDSYLPNNKNITDKIILNIKGMALLYFIEKEPKLDSIKSYKEKLTEHIIATRDSYKEFNATLPNDTLDKLQTILHNPDDILPKLGAILNKNVNNVNSEINNANSRSNLYNMMINLGLDINNNKYNDILDNVINIYNIYTFISTRKEFNEIDIEGIKEEKTKVLAKLTKYKTYLNNIHEISKDVDNNIYPTKKNKQYLEDKDMNVLSLIKYHNTNLHWLHDSYHDKLTIVNKTLLEWITLIDTMMDLIKTINLDLHLLKNKIFIIQDNINNAKNKIKEGYELIQILKNTNIINKTCWDRLTNFCKIELEYPSELMKIKSSKQIEIKSIAHELNYHNIMYNNILLYKAKPANIKDESEKIKNILYIIYTLLQRDTEESKLCILFHIIRYIELCYINYKFNDNNKQILKAIESLYVLYVYILSVNYEIKYNLHSDCSDKTAYEKSKSVLSKLCNNETLDQKDNIILSGVCRPLSKKEEFDRLSNYKDKKLVDINMIEFIKELNIAKDSIYTHKKLQSKYLKYRQKYYKLKYNKDAPLIEASLSTEQYKQKYIKYRLKYEMLKNNTTNHEVPLI